MAIKHTSCVSSNLVSHGYDPESKVMEVKFKNGGTYAYKGVAQTHYDAFTKAESLGKHLHEHIKGKFSFEKVS